MNVVTVFKSLGVGLCLFSTLAARQAATYDLVWRPHADDSMAYKLRLDIDSSPEKFTFLANIKTHVLKVKPNGDYDVEQTTHNARVIHGLQSEEITDDNKPTVDTYNARGQKISTSVDNDPSEEANPGFNTLDAVTDQLSPKTAVAVGGTWSAVIQANPKQKRQAAKVDYALAGRVTEGAYPCLKVEYKYRETDRDNPVTAEGYILVDLDDFSLVRFEGTIKGAQFSDDPDFPNGDTTLSMIRT